MEKLIKPQQAMENLTDDVIEALCEFDGCGSNCRILILGSCYSVNDAESDDDILF